MESLLQEYVEDRTFEGHPPEGSFTGAAGGAACGDLARISLVAGPAERDAVASGSAEGSAPDRRIARVTFGTEGCAATRAACACLAGMVDGARLLDA
ncbi:MAG: hypothetical protein M3Y45_02680, partial [Actinomycetota bacterium]|nr:hypothetical protein [Actinomycetota bacterium]